MGAFWSGLRLRCPACRAGRMSPSWRSLLTLHDRCPACGLPFIPGPGESVGGVEIAVYLAALLGLLGSAMLLIARAGTLALVVWVVGFGVLFPLAAYRHCRGAWVGAMYALQAWPLAGDPPHVAPIAMPALPWDEP